MLLIVLSQRIAKSLNCHRVEISFNHRSSSRKPVKLSGSALGNFLFKDLSNRLLFINRVLFLEFSGETDDSTEFRR